MKDLFKDADMMVPTVEKDTIVYDDKEMELGLRMKKEKEELAARVRALDLAANKHIRNAKTDPTKPKVVKKVANTIGYIDLGYNHAVFLASCVLDGYTAKESIGKLNDKYFQEADQQAFTTTVGNMEPILVDKAFKELAKQGHPVLENVRSKGLLSVALYSERTRTSTKLSNVFDIVSAVDAFIKTEDRVAVTEAKVATLEEDVKELKANLKRVTQATVSKGILDWKVAAIDMRAGGMAIKDIAEELGKNVRSVSRAINEAK